MTKIFATFMVGGAHDVATLTNNILIYCCIANTDPTLVSTAYEWQLSVTIDATATKEDILALADAQAKSDFEMFTGRTIESSNIIFL